MATLYVVSTPIGNLDDVSPRAARTLRSVHRILAEDTRRTRILADHVGAQAPMISLHAHNEAERTDEILAWLNAGEDLALVSDAGTPVVSAAAGHPVLPVPGPSAVTAALAVAGLPGDRFSFLGFTPRKGEDRDARLRRVAETDETVILFESPHRLVRLLDDLREICEEGRRAVVARELTKLHEEVVRGTLPEVARYYRESPPRGEVTVVVAPAGGDAESGDLREEAVRLSRQLLEDGMRPSSVAKEVAARLDLARNEAYRIVHDLEGTDDRE